MKKYLEGCSNAETGKVLKVLAELTERTGFESALGTVTQALCYDATDADSLRNLYRRLYSDVPELPPMPLGSAIPDLGQMPANLVSYDSFLKTGVSPMLEDKIIACCKKLRLSRNLADMAMTMDGESHQEYLYKLLVAELRNREQLRTTKLINAAGFYSIKTFDSFRFDEVSYRPM